MYNWNSSLFTHYNSVKDCPYLGDKGSQIQGIPKSSQSRGVHKGSHICHQYVTRGSQIQGVPKGSQLDLKG